jgi:putative DNA primase/helicase
MASKDEDIWAEPPAEWELPPEVVALAESDAGPVGGQIRLANRLAQSDRDRLLFVHGIGWHYWDGRRWAEDDSGHGYRAVLEVLRLEAIEATAQRDKALRAQIERCETDHGVRGILAIASRLTAFAATVRDIDADPYLINLANGTYDLHTDELRDHKAADRITKVARAAYRPDAAGAGDWERFLGQALPDPDVRGYFQRVAGLALLGKVKEHILPIATGTGGNGKGVAYGAILHSFGDYAYAAENDLFTSAKGNANAASPALMGLLGRRLVVVSETERDQPLAQALMKLITGGDPITARPLYGKPVTFDPSHTALLVTNALPKVAGDDPAIWRRVRVIPFEVSFTDRPDTALGERLALAADEVMAWAIGGWRDYREHGMRTPDAVTVATQAYRTDSDAVARFIDERCIKQRGMSISASSLFEAWQSWSADDGAEPLSKRAFGQALDRHGIPAGKATGGIRVRAGITIRAEISDD